MITADLAAGREAWRNEGKTPEEKQERERSSFLKYADAAGRFADFHSLRHTFISNLAKAGVHPKNAQALARSRRGFGEELMPQLRGDVPSGRAPWRPQSPRFMKPWWCWPPTQGVFAFNAANIHPEPRES